MICKHISTLYCIQQCILFLAQLFVTEPLEIQQCIDIGYSSAIVNVCKQVADFADCEDGIMFGEFESDVVLWDCAQSDAKTQQELQVHSVEFTFVPPFWKCYI